MNWSLPCLCLFALFFTVEINPEIKDATSNDRQAIALLKGFFAGEKKARKLSKKLIPTVKECRAFFTPRVSRKACRRYIRQLSSSLNHRKRYIRPGEKETELLIWRARISKLRKSSSEISRFFPTGYNEVAPFIRLRHVVYRFKFVRPGDSTGRPYDGLVKIKGKWRIFRRPWRILPYVDMK